MGMEILKVCLCRNQDQSQIKSKTELETHLTDSSHLDPEAEREISPLIVDEGDHTPDNSYANHSAQFIQSYGEGLIGAQAAWANRKYHGHQILPPDMIQEIKASIPSE